MSSRSSGKFTGMVFDFTERRKLKKSLVDDILKRNNITGSAVTLTTPELFQIDDASPRLDESKSEKFHSEVASISTWSRESNLNVSPQHHSC